jgi:hypothetical protein
VRQPHSPFAPPVCGPWGGQPLEPLEDQFEARLRAAIQECIALGYRPQRFMEMLDTYGSRALAKRLIASGDLQDGIRRVAAMGRLDLSMEHIMLEAEFAPLFTAQELEAARWRLDQLS